MLINFILNFISVVCIFYIFYKVWDIKKNVTRRLTSINKLNKIILDQVQDLHIEAQHQFDSFNQTINSQSKKILEIEKKNIDQATSNIELAAKIIESLNQQNISKSAPPGTGILESYIPNNLEESDEVVLGEDVEKESELARGGIVKGPSPILHDDYVIPSKDVIEGGLPPALGEKSSNSFNNETVIFNPMQEQINRNMSIKKSGN